MGILQNSPRHEHKKESNNPGIGIWQRARLAVALGCQQRRHVGEESATGADAIQPLLRHVAEDEAEGAARRRFAAPDHLARIRSQRAGDDADERAFARAVGA